MACARRPAPAAYAGLSLALLLTRLARFRAQFKHFANPG
jgi:hypothetical protein